MTEKTDNIKPNSGSEFDKFVSASRAYFDAIAVGVVKASGKHDDLALVEAHAESLREQAGKVLDFTVQRYADGNAETKRFVEELCEVQAITGMAQRSTKTFQQSVQRGIFGDGLFSWIESVAQEIKKLINEIWSIFGNVPEWFEVLKQIIDQIIKFLMSLFGGILGRNRSRISADLSNMEVEFWNELSARRKFVNTLTNKGNEIED